MSARDRLRWQVVDTDGAPAPGAVEQPALFETPPEREIGTGEFRGLEFLHVQAKRIINEVPTTSPVPFRFTINAYRGCSMSCTYCQAGDTRVLMADGCTKLLADVRRGDRVYGTERHRAYREYVVTEVRDQWSTVKRAHRVALVDGTELVASGDHRYLSTRGWRHVAQLTDRDELVTIERGPTPVSAVKDLEVELPMFDITTGTGDFIANGVVSHNCFARPTHEYLNLNMADDWESVIVVKLNAVERLRAEVSPKRWRGEHIAMGTNTDPYQRAEGKYRLTRGLIEVLARERNPFSILTKGTLVLRDLDVLVEAAQRTSVSLNFSIGTLDESVWKATEPGTPHPRKRVEAVAKLNEAGVPCGVLVAPILPGLSDSAEQLDEVVGACVAAGATSISSVLLHLRPGVREHYLGWLEQHDPDLLARHHALYRRAYAPAAERDRIAQLVQDLIAKHRRRR